MTRAQGSRGLVAVALAAFLATVLIVAFMWVWIDGNSLAIQSKADAEAYAAARLRQEAKQ